MLAVCSPFALGQAMPGATRVLDVQAGATFTWAKPDYTPQNAMGYGIFGTFDFTPHWGAELDFNSVSIQQHAPAKEWTFEYGARYHRTYGRYNPYAKLAAGRGTFDSNPDFYQGNTSLGYNLLAFGGGVDTEITSRISIRVGAEYQDWFTGGLKGALGVGGPGQDTYLPNGLTPFLIQVGASYHFTGGSTIH
ncbi:MAG: outer membrane beta-barrel protein [Acidobacteriaceae bacterium]